MESMPDKQKYTLANVDIRNSSGHESGIRFGLVQHCEFKLALVMRFMNSSTIIKISSAKLLRCWKDT